MMEIEESFTPVRTSIEEQRRSLLGAASFTGRDRRDGQTNRIAQYFPASSGISMTQTRRRPDHPALVRYGIAVVAVTLAVAGRLALTPVLGSQFPLITLFPAVVYSAWFGGLGPSLLSLGLTMLAVPLVLYSSGSLVVHGLAAQVGFGLYAVSGLAIALMGGSMRGALLRAEQSAEATLREQLRLQAEIARRRRAEAENEQLLDVQRELRSDAERHSATLSKLFEQLPVGVTAFDTELRIIRINAYNAALNGQTPERLIGMRLREVLRDVHGRETADHLEAQFRKVLETGEPMSFTSWSGELAHRPGEPFFADWSIRRIENQAGDPVGLLLTTVEVTDRVVGEQQLRASEQRFRTMADASPALIWTSDTDARCTYLNRPWLDFTGRGLEEQLGDGWLESVHPEDRAGCREVLADAIRARRPFRMTYRLRRHDGEERWILDHGVPWLAADGIFLGYIGSCVDIHDQKHLEAQRDRLLAELEARHAFTEAILSQVPAGIIVADALTGKLFLSNQAAHRMVHGELQPGHLLEEYDETFELAAFHPDGRRYRTEEWPLVRALRQGERVVDEELTVVSGDGTQLTLSVNAGPVRDPAGSVVAAVAAFHDVTGRKRAELEVARSAAQLRHLADAIPQIVWSTTSDRSVIFFNRRWFDYTGLSEERSYQPGGYADAVHPEDLPNVVEAYQRSKATGEPFESEYRLRDREGRYRWFLGRAVSVPDEHGRPICQFGTATDIDEHKRAEQAARFLADASTALSALVDEDHALQQVANLAVPHFADWCVVDMAVPGGEPRRLAVAHVDAAKVALAHEVHRRYPPDPEARTGIFEILRTGNAELISETTQEMLDVGVNDDNHRRILGELGLRSYMGVPLRGRTGILGVISFIAAESGRHYDAADLRLAQDLACRAAIAVENARLYQELRDADRRKDEFLATLAHELRNPLAPIRSSLYLMSSLDGEAHEAERQRAQRLVTHLGRLVDDLVDVARINKGLIELRKEVVELSSIVHRAAEAVKCWLLEQGHELTIALPDAPVYLEADPTRIEQVLWNLLSNAIKYTPPGGKIRLVAGADRDRVEIRLSDNGIGMGAEHLPHIFDMFARGDSRLKRNHQGLGIGLGLVKSLVEMHGGTMHARSDGPGKGSEFRISLPAHPAPEGAPRTAASREPTAPAIATCRVLVVDDNQDAANSLALILSIEDGHETRVALDGPSALALAETFRPDVVILDIGMPGMDGYEVARRLKATPENRGMKFMVLSGWGQEQDRRRSREVGIEHHLVKGVDPMVVRETVLQCLRAADEPSAPPELAAGSEDATVG